MGSKKSKLARFAKNSSLSLMSLVFTALIVFGCLYFYMVLSLPNVDQLKDVHLQVPLRVYTKDNKLIAEFGEKKRIPVTIDQVPPLLIKAILDTEDQRFYEHRGVDFFGLVRATIAVITSGRKSQGASTITMQVARNFFLSPEKTYLRKINEMLLAFKIDRSFSKEEVLELYLNKIYLGQRAYGVAAASYVYFGKPLSQLTLAQMALIAGLPQAPSRDNPLANPQASLDRRNHVLERMLENKHITLAQYKAASAAPLGISSQGLQVEVEAPYLAEMVRNAMVAQFGDAAYDSGYKVYTTLDSQLQNIANNALRNGVMAYEERHGYRGPEGHLRGNGTKALRDWQDQLRQIPIYGGLIPAGIVSVSNEQITAILSNGETVTVSNNGFSWTLRGKVNARSIFSNGNVIRLRKIEDGSWRIAQLPKLEGAFVSLNTKTGAVLALTGGFSYAQSSFNRAVQAGRQTGSGFKPFIYSAALAKGYTLASVINDAPVAIAIPGTNMVWRPQNDNQRFYGPTRLRVGLIQSRNLVSVRLLQAIGVPYAAEYVKQFGFTNDEIPAMPSLALGVAAISPLKLAAGYAVFANGGYKITPYFIDNIVDRDGSVMFRANPAQVLDDESSSATQTSQANVPLAPRVITPQNAYLITSALKDVIFYGTARRAAVLKRSDLAGKTGTTNDQVDGWFAGYNNDIVAVAWMGFDKPKSLYEHGAQVALPVWMEFMSHVLQGKPEHSLPQPEDIVAVHIDPSTGLLASPGESGAIFEFFTKDTVPTEEAVGGQGMSADEIQQSVGSDDDTVVTPLF